MWAPVASLPIPPPLPNVLPDPYINDCNYDGAGRALNALYGPLNPSVSSVNANLLQFDQTLFGTGGSLNTVGYVYDARVWTRISVPMPTCVSVRGKSSPRMCSWWCL